MAYADIAHAREEQETRPPEKEAWGVLRSVLWLQLVESDSETSPLGPEQLFDSIPREALAALAGCLPSIGDPELVARIADAAWLRQRACTHEVARQGVQAYLDAARRLHDPEHWVEGYQRLRRAVELAVSLGRKDNDALEAAFDEVERVIDALGEADPLYFSTRLSTVLLTYRRGDPAKYAALASAIASRAQAAGDYDRARTLLDLRADWLTLAKREKAARTSKLRVARLFEKEADELAASGHLPRATALLQQAVGALRRLGGQGKRVSALRVKLQAVQRKVPATFARHETSLDLSEHVAQARAQVSGKGPLEALVALAALRGAVDVDRLRKQAQETLRTAVFYAMVPKAKISAAGRVVHAHGGAFDDPDAAIDAEVHQNLALLHEIFAKGGIMPAVEQIQREHGLRASDLVYLAGRSPFVPPRREIAFARGLAAGLQGEFDVAAHLLMPQFENAVRLLVERHGGITTTLPNSGQQNELDLNCLLDLDIVVQVFGESETFDLTSLLTKKAGTNLRNELAHGLIDDSDTPLFAYFWWVVLRHVLIPALHTREASASTAAEVTPKAKGAKTASPPKRPTKKAPPAASPPTRSPARTSASPAQTRRARLRRGG